MTFVVAPSIFVAPPDTVTVQVLAVASIFLTSKPTPARLVLLYALAAEGRVMVTAPDAALHKIV